jgi:hypothetical protein
MLLVGLLAWPAVGRVYVECANGRACSPSPAVDAATDCCPPRPCDEHPAPPTDQRCVVKEKSAPVRVTPPPTIDSMDLPPLAILPTATVTPPPVPTATLAVPEESPPPYLSPEQGRAARAPPCA